MPVFLYIPGIEMTSKTCKDATTYPESDTSRVAKTPSSIRPVSLATRLPHIPVMHDCGKVSIDAILKMLDIVKLKISDMLQESRLQKTAADYGTPDDFLAFIAQRIRQPSNSSDSEAGGIETRAAISYKQCTQLLREYFAPDSNTDALFYISIIMEIKEKIKEQRDKSPHLRMTDIELQREEIRECRNKVYRKNSTFDHASLNIRFNRDLHCEEDRLQPRKLNQITSAILSPLCNISVGRIYSKGNNPTVLQVRGTDIEMITCDELCSIFSNYGNIQIGVVNKEKKHTLIKYTTPAGAYLGSKYLNGIRLFGRMIKVSFSLLADVEERWFSNQIEYFFQDADTNRFKKEVPTVVYPVSTVLRCCVQFTQNERKVDNNEILGLILPLSKPTNFRRFSNIRNMNVWIAEFRSLDDAALVMVKLHLHRYEEGIVKISFTRSNKNIVINGLSEDN